MSNLMDKVANKLSGHNQEEDWRKEGRLGKNQNRPSHSDWQDDLTGQSFGGGGYHEGYGQNEGQSYNQGYGTNQGYSLNQSRGQQSLGHQGAGHETLGLQGLSSGDQYGSLMNQGQNTRGTRTRSLAKNFDDPLYDSVRNTGY